MIFLFIFLGAFAGMLIGYSVGRGLKRANYDGVLKMYETEKGLLYSLELIQDPELLANQDEVVFKVAAPDYDKLLSQ